MTSSFASRTLAASILRSEKDGTFRPTKRRKGRRVSWDSELTKIRYFFIEDAPQLAGGDQYQPGLGQRFSGSLNGKDGLVPKRWHGIASKPRLARSGSKGSGYLPLDSKQLAEAVARVKWRRPMKIPLPEDWGIAYGDGSEEFQVQENRQRLALEAVYPRAASIPTSPAEPPTADQVVDEKTHVPDIPLLPIEDEEEEENLGPTAAAGPDVQAHAPDVAVALGGDGGGVSGAVQKREFALGGMVGGTPGPSASSSAGNNNHGDEDGQQRPANSVLPHQPPMEKAPAIAPPASENTAAAASSAEASPEIAAAAAAVFASLCGSHGVRQIDGTLLAAIVAQLRALEGGSAIDEHLVSSMVEAAATTAAAAAAAAGGGGRGRAGGGDGDVSGRVDATAAAVPVSVPPPAVSQIPSNPVTVDEEAVAASAQQAKYRDAIERLVAQTRREGECLEQHSAATSSSALAPPLPPGMPPQLGAPLPGPQRSVIGPGVEMIPGTGSPGVPPVPPLHHFPPPPFSSSRPPPRPPQRPPFFVNGEALPGPPPPPHGTLLPPDNLLHPLSPPPLRPPFRPPPPGSTGGDGRPSFPHHPARPQQQLQPPGLAEHGRHHHHAPLTRFPGPPRPPLPGMAAAAGEPPPPFRPLSMHAPPHPLLGHEMFGPPHPHPPHLPGMPPFSRPLDPSLGRWRPPGPHGWNFEEEHRHSKDFNGMDKDKNVPETKGRPKKECAFFNTPQGCRNGVNCTFLHQLVTEKPPLTPHGNGKL